MVIVYEFINLTTPVLRGTYPHFKAKMFKTKGAVLAWIARVQRCSGGKPIPAAASLRRSWEVNVMTCATKGFPRLTPAGPLL